MRRRSKRILAILFSIWATSLQAHVVLNTPVGGEEFNAGEAIDIAWQIDVDHGTAVWDLFFSSDGGLNWTEIIKGLPKSTLSYSWTPPAYLSGSVRIRVVQNNTTGTDYESASGDFTILNATAVQDRHAAQAAFIFHPPYPNPLNSVTVLRLSFPGAGPFSIEIYNLSSRLVTRFTGKASGLGTHHIEWHPAALPSGIYFCRACFNGTIITQRCTLIH